MPGHLTHHSSLRLSRSGHRLAWHLRLWELTKPFPGAGHSEQLPELRQEGRGRDSSAAAGRGSPGTSALSSSQCTVAHPSTATGCLRSSHLLLLCSPSSGERQGNAWSGISVAARSPGIILLYDGHLGSLCLCQRDPAFGQQMPMFSEMARPSRTGTELPLTTSTTPGTREQCGTLLTGAW